MDVHVYAICMYIQVIVYLCTLYAYRWVYVLCMHICVSLPMYICYMDVCMLYAFTHVVNLFVHCVWMCVHFMYVYHMDLDVCALCTHVVHLCTPYVFGCVYALRRYICYSVP